MAAVAKDLTAEIPIEFRFKGVIDKNSGKIESIAEITGGKIDATDIDGKGKPVTSTDVIAAAKGAVVPVAVKYSLKEFNDNEFKTLTDAFALYTAAVAAVVKENTDTPPTTLANKVKIEGLIKTANDEKAKVDPLLTAANAKITVIVDPTEKTDAETLIKNFETDYAIEISKITVIDTAVAAIVTGGAKHRQSRKSKKAGGKKRRKSQRRKQSKN